MSTDSITVSFRTSKQEKNVLETLARQQFVKRGKLVQGIIHDYLIRNGHITNGTNPTGIVLGIDPGYARIGWGVIQGETCLGYGCIETQAGDDITKRYRQIFTGITGVINQYHPQAVGIERLFFNKNITTAMRVSEARGVIMSIISRQRIPVYEPTPAQIKAEVAHGKATKQEVQKNVQLIFNLDHIPKPDDAADGLAVALYVGRIIRTESMIIKS